MGPGAAEGGGPGLSPHTQIADRNQTGNIRIVYSQRKLKICSEIFRPILFIRDHISLRIIQIEFIPNHLTDFVDSFPLVSVQCAHCSHVKKVEITFSVLVSGHGGLSDTEDEEEVGARGRGG